MKLASEVTLRDVQVSVFMVEEEEDSNKKRNPSFGFEVRRLKIKEKMIKLVSLGEEA